ncbi:MAG: exodeoxyribonuclease VII large subunit [Chloroflexi bacterium]|nr:exodeoxyribonuclease VII large subunit [Chloroflexota bacterium]
MQILTVGDVNSAVKELLESDPDLQDLWLEGEVSNASRSPAGHLYFTLKDGSSQLRCVMFRGQLAYQRLVPQNGLAIVAHGRISVYEPQGAYQLYVDLVQPQGVGLLHLQFEQLRQRLEQEGLFDPARKRPLPLFPRAIGVVTSPTGAALRDILNVLERRYPLAEVVLVPTTVQGDAAPAQIVSALQAANLHCGLDVVILARGGGSIEELWAFNDERVARAIFASRVPVITGVGHETDVTIADLVADLRAPTPSAAAELAVPDREECLVQIESFHSRLERALSGLLISRRNDLELTRRSLDRVSPAGLIARLRASIDDRLKRQVTSVNHAHALRAEQLTSQRRRLAALNPRAVLDRGYSMCWLDGEETPVRSVVQARPGLSLRVQVADGEFGAVVGGGERPPRGASGER